MKLLAERERLRTSLFNRILLPRVYTYRKRNLKSGRLSHDIPIQEILVCYKDILMNPDVSLECVVNHTICSTNNFFCVLYSAIR